MSVKFNIVDITGTWRAVSGKNNNKEYLERKKLLEHRTRIVNKILKEDKLIDYSEYRCEHLTPINYVEYLYDEEKEERKKVLEHRTRILEEIIKDDE